MILAIYIRKSGVVFLKRYKQFIDSSLFSSGTIKCSGNDGKEPGPELGIISK
jgi:hypothetical protein